MQKLYFGRLQQWIHAVYRMPAQKIIWDQKIIENLLLL